LIYIGKDVADVFDANTESNEIWRDSRGTLFFFRQLLMCRRGRVNHKRFRVSNVGEQREQLE